MSAAGIGAGIGAGFGLLNAISDKIKQARERERREAEIRLSPWTKMAPTTQPREANTLQAISGGGLGGYQMGADLDDQSAWERLYAMLQAQQSGKEDE
jgi:hypothetical protein